MKKLIPALALLLVSATLMSTASFAWFSMNTEVDASGMAIQAKVPTQLLIKGSAGSAEYKNSISFVNATDSANSGNNAKQNLVPVAYKARATAASHAAIVAENAFKKLTEAGMALVKDDGTVTGGYTAEGLSENATADDFIKDTFKLKLNGVKVDDAELKVEIVATAAAGSGATVLEEENGIYAAIHIAIVNTSGTIDSVDYNSINEFDLGAGTFDGENNTVTISATNLVKDNFAADNGEFNYTVFIWYDGEDADCKNDNAINIDNWTFDFKFTYDVPTP